VGRSLKALGILLRKTLSSEPRINVYEANFVRRAAIESWSSAMKRTQWSEQSNNEREHDLKRASEFHAVLLGMAGHDLRQPLHVIQSTYERLSHAVDSDAENVQLRQRELLRRGESAVARLTEQLDRLAGALRLYEYTSRMELSPVPLAPLFDSVWSEGVEPARESRVHLRVRPTAAVVMSNALLLDGIVRNLVRNAIKYTPASGRVLLACRARGDHMRIDVYDTGVGVSAVQLPRIFEAFQRLDSTSPDGLGLGLFVVRRAVELLGHRIEVSSAVGRGSRFSVLVKAAATPDGVGASVIRDAAVSEPCC